MQRPGGVALLAAEQQIARSALAEHLGQQQRSRVARHEPDPDLGRQEPDAVRAQPQVAACCELQGAPDADAVDDRDHGHGGREHDARHALEALDRRRPRGAVGLDRALQVIAGREVLARTAQHDAADRLVGARLLDRVGDRGHGLQVPCVAARLAVPDDHARGVLGFGGHGHRASSLLSSSTAGGSTSPRAVRWTIRVLCSATGSEPGSSRVTAKRARSVS